MKLWAPTVFKDRLRDYSEYKNEFHTGPAWMRVQAWEGGDIHVNESPT